jgi:hypothetical protein
MLAMSIALEKSFGFAIGVCIVRLLVVTHSSLEIRFPESRRT